MPDDRPAYILALPQYQRTKFKEIFAYLSLHHLWHFLTFISSFYSPPPSPTHTQLRDRVVVYILGSAGQTLSQNKDAQRRFEEAIGAITNTNPVIETVELLSEKQGEEEKIDVPEGQK